MRDSTSDRDRAVGEERPERGRTRGGIGAARAYTPRGRTVAERGRMAPGPETAGHADDTGRNNTGRNDTGRNDTGRKGTGHDGGRADRSRSLADRDQRTRSARSGRTTDPFRPALQVLDGGRRDKDRTGSNKSGRSGRTSFADDDEFDTPEQSAPRRGLIGRQRTRDDRPGSGRAGGGRSGGKGGIFGRTGNKAPETRRTVTGPRGSRAIRAVVTEPPKLANSTRRLRLGAVMALALFAMIGVRLVTLQVAASPQEVAKLLQLRDDRIADISLLAPRGSILDSGGYVLANSIEARLVAVDPQIVKNPAREAAILAPMIDQPASTLVGLMTPHKRPDGAWSQYEYLAHGIPIATGDAIEKLDLAGIIVSKDEVRSYPGYTLASNLIGFTGEDQTGQEGLETKYNALLQGKAGEHIYEHGLNDPDTPIPGGYDKYTAPQPGVSIELTVDHVLQYEVQSILKTQLDAEHATIGGAVVIDVKTGAVIAQASYPSYNSADYSSYPQSDWQDVPSRVIADPGSVHKAIVFGAALQEGVITPSSTVTVGPAIRLGGYNFADDTPQPKGTQLTMGGVLALSSNVGTILIAQKLGAQKLYEYQKKFGLGSSVNEGVEGEVPGALLPPSQWSGSAYGSVPIGMSVDATLVQMAGAYEAIANDGTYIQPHIIKAEISGQDGTVTPAPKPETHQVLTPGIAQELRQLMEGVITGAGATGTRASVPGYRVAGKTGTGRRLVNGEYTADNYDTFVGMAPAENPRYVIAVSADVPKGTAGTVVAPAFSQMMQYVLWHNGVAPSTTPAPPVKIHP